MKSLMCNYLMNKKMCLQVAMGLSLLVMLLENNQLWGHRLETIFLQQHASLFSFLIYRDL